MASLPDFWNFATKICTERAALGFIVKRRARISARQLYLTAYLLLQFPWLLEIIYLLYFIKFDGINLTTYNGLLLTRVWKFRFRYYGLPPGLRLTQGPVQAQTLIVQVPIYDMKLCYNYGLRTLGFILSRILTSNF